MNRALPPRTFIIRWSLCVMMSALVVSCGTSRKNVITGSSATIIRPVTDKTDSHHPHQPSGDPLVALINEAKSWEGTPYRWGGNDRDGVDCSGFVTQVFNNALGIKLPRTSSKQSTFCTPLPIEQLEPGDLLFFATDASNEGNVSHVGMYIGNDCMIHSSSSRGVIVSRIDGNYYRRTFHSAGRVGQLQAMINLNPSRSVPSPVPSPEQTGIEVATIAQTEQIEAVPAEKIKPSVKVEEPRQKTAVKTHVDRRPAAKKPVNTVVNAPAPAEKASPAAVPSSASDARTMFLNSIIEEKVDSIFANR